MNNYFVVLLLAIVVFFGIITADETPTQDSKIFTKASKIEERVEILKKYDICDGLLGHIISFTCILKKIISKFG